MSKTILVVDDEARLVNLVKAYLEQGGFRVVTARNGREALFIARQEKPDLILLDIMMPEMDGHEFMRVHRQERATPIILLTAKVEEDDKIIGLELGADDYVTKPFSPRELMARVRAVLRRGGDVEEVGDTILEAGPVRMDIERHVVSVDGEQIALPLKEFDLLEYLMRNKGRVLTRGQLIDRVWGADYVGDTKTLDVHVKRLRSKIEADPGNPARLLTVRGLGYKLEG